MRVRWCLTVCSLMANWLAMSRLLRPATMADTISSSRPVRPRRSRSSWAADTSRRMYSTRSPTSSRPTQYWPSATQRMHLKRWAVEASLSRTPRAPRWRVSTAFERSIAAVSTMVRTGMRPADSSSSTCRPDTLGMTMSRSRPAGRIIVGGAFGLMGLAVEDDPQRLGLVQQVQGRVHHLAGSLVRGHHQHHAVDGGLEKTVVRTRDDWRRVDDQVIVSAAGFRQQNGHS